MGPAKRSLLRALVVLSAVFVHIFFSAATASAMQADKGEKDPCPGPESLATPESAGAVSAGPGPFVWPAPLPRKSEPVVPQSIGFAGWPEFRARLVSDLYRHAGANPAADLGDTLLKGPELLLDETFTRIGSMSDKHSARTSEEEEERSITARILSIQFNQRDRPIITVFLEQWAASEEKYLGTFEDSRANTFGFENRTQDADLAQLALDQRKVIWNTVRRTYLARYKVSSEEQIHNEAWYFDRWSGIDFALLPPFIAAYLFYRGLDKRISLGGMAVQIAFEPINQLRDRKRDRPAAASLEWSVKGVPVGIIVSSGLYDGRYQLDFVGIGTSIGSARGAVLGEYLAPGR